MSAFDSDTRPSPHYFTVLSYTYLTNPDRDVDSYQPVLLFHNNAWEVPTASRLVGYVASMWTLVDSTRPERLRIFSSHALGMKALVGVNYWSTNVIPDDSRQYWRMYYGSDGRAKTVPLHLPVYLDAVHSRQLVGDDEGAVQADPALVVRGHRLPVPDGAERPQRADPVARQGAADVPSADPVPPVGDRAAAHPLPASAGRTTCSRSSPTPA